MAEDLAGRDVRLFDNPAFLYYTRNRRLPAWFLLFTQGGADHASARWPAGPTPRNGDLVSHFATKVNSVEAVFRRLPRGTKAVNSGGGIDLKYEADFIVGRLVATGCLTQEVPRNGKGDQ